MKFNTLAVHAGVEPDPATGAIMTPIYQTSTYVQSSPGVHKGYEYSRTHNPTRSALQAAIAALEGARHATVFSSGLAATDALVRTLRPGDEVLACNDLYGGTFRLFQQVLAPFGLSFRFVDMSDPATAEQAIGHKTKMVWIETPTNPLLRIIDIKAWAKVAKAKGATVVVDNTFSSPALQQPLSLGADVVVHSLTKYMGGHSDTVMGAVVTNNEELDAQMKYLANAAGATPGPQDCFLLLRSLKTLHVRMERHCQNAEKVAAYLKDHPKVAHVYFPGLPEHPNHEVAKQQMKAFGGMVSFYTKGDTLAEAKRLLEHVKLFALAESLGGVESLAGHPATMTHASIPAEERHKAGLKDSLIRLSVGIEDADDLMADLEAALAHV